MLALTVLCSFPLSQNRAFPVRDPKVPHGEARERAPDPMSDPAQAQRGIISGRCLSQGLPIQFEDMVFLLQSASLTLSFYLKP